jgi:hypothetical protein
LRGSKSKVFFFEPELTARIITEVPVNHFAGVLVKEFPLSAGEGIDVGHE